MPHLSLSEFQSKVLASGVVADTTTEPEELGNWERGGLLIRGIGLANRTAVVSVEVSPDGKTFVPYRRLKENTAAGAFVASVSVNASGNTLVWFDHEAYFNYLRVVIDVTDAANPAGTFEVHLFSRS
jgi:hypothetical protein